MRILFLTTIHLSKNCNGGEVASQCFIDALRNLEHQVTVVGYLRKGDQLENNSKETLIVDERYTETNKSKFFALFWLLQSFFQGLPYSSAKYYSRLYISLVKKLLKINTYDIIIVDHAQLGWIQHFIGQKIKLIAIAHNVEHEIYQESLKKAGNFISKLIYKREARLIRTQEERLFNAAEEVWTLTEHDAKCFSQLEWLSKIRTFGIPPGFTKLQEKVVDKCFDVGLIGSWSWKANIEALEWFLQAVYPYLPTNLSIHIAGKGADWLTDKYPNIYYHGVVPDAQEFMAKARVVAIPTVSGSGIQIKTLDAIASGSFIVATPIALRGISDPPSTVRVTQNSEEFANFLAIVASLPVTKKDFDEAKGWYRIRKENFLKDIACAIKEL